MKWGEFPKAEQERWDAAMDLGDAGRKTIKGHELKFYLDAMSEVRARSLAEFKKLDDAWLMTVDKDWVGGRRTIAASGFMCASMSRIMPARSIRC